MKGKKGGIKRKTILYFTIFAAILLALLWTFQTVFLENFYKAVKRYSIQTSAELLERSINSDDLQQIIDRLAKQNDMAVRIFQDNTHEMTTSEQVPDAVISHMSISDLSVLYKRAKENGGTAFEIMQVVYDPIFRFPGMVTPAEGENMVYVSVFRMPDEREVMIVLSSEITPVGATVYTLRIQLICITAILLVMAFVLALLLARAVSKPIVTLNEKAKKLAVGDYTTDYHTDGYREISELGNTLNYAAHELSTVEALRRDLLANISHDLRTPLTLITGYSEAMRDLPGENTPENIQKVIDEASRLSLLVNDIMDLSKLQSGTQPMYFREFAFTESMQNIVSRLTVLTHVQGYTIHFNCADQVIVCGDEKQLERVAYNLIQNALQHTGEDRTVMVNQYLCGPFVRIEVSDSGKGIPEAELAHIWDRYYKLDRTERNRAMGTGLGLSIVKATLEAHGARFGVISAEGYGSTFWYELPIVPFGEE